MKKKNRIYISIIFTTFIVLTSAFWTWNNYHKKRVGEVIKNIKKNKTIPYKITSIDIKKSRNVKNHFTDLKDVLFYKNDNIITRGGIIQNGYVNRFFNGSEFSFIDENQGNIIVGYRNGFLLIQNQYINRFEFDETLKTCSFSKMSSKNLENSKIFCIKGKSVLKKEKKDFVLFSQLSEKIIDFINLDNVSYILTEKSLHIVSNSNKKTFKIVGKKFFVHGKDVFVISDREIFKLSNFSIMSFKKIVSISDMFFYKDNVFYVTLNGLVLDNNLKKIYDFNSLVNRVEEIEGKIYFSTSRGVFRFFDDFEKLNIEVLNKSLQENYITKIFPYKKDVLIGYFNSGVDIFNKNGILRPYVKDIYGVNDFFSNDEALFIASTNGLLKIQDGKKIFYDKKSGLLGRSVSQIAYDGYSIFLSTEAGVSKKVDDIFLSMNGLHGLVNNRVNTIKFIKNKLYAGTLGGVSLLKDLDFIKNMKNSDFDSKWITDIIEIKGDIYIATYGGGIYKSIDDYNLDKITTKKNGDYQGRIFVNLHTLLNYKNKYLLAGTLKKGVLVYDLNKNVFYFVDELPSLNITALNIIDEELFVGSDFGFWTMNIKDILE